ncbi:MAG: UDP-N-acetylglucosamine 1-carboxyvinyltransferase [Flavobacteriales bacterium]|jgi:UDP-N-acetylglucosamine 1-carboxyvinyltransferase|nr:UDP-N-acetylglucosamine 1-carboxyvinyltransferase [Flavobacteriales bacterium]
MNSFRIEGGRRLKGELVPQGAKNEALQILCAVLLTSEPMTIHNIPDIVDVNKLIDLLKAMGVAVERLGAGSYRFQAKDVNLEFFLDPEYKRMGGSLRGSVMVAGPALARFGRGYIPSPGGDRIGRRRMDTHFIGFERLGAAIRYDEKEGFFHAEAKKLKGCYMLLDEASVTGTANIIMAATLANGRTTIFNAACEPYIQQLCRMLVRMGARIEGIGSNLLHIDGVKELGGTEHRMLPDMIEIGSFIGLAALTRSTITIKDTGYDHLGIIPDVFRKLGIAVIRQGDDIHVPAQEHYEIEPFLDGSNRVISDHPWPGFTPDLLSIVLVTATQASGHVLIHQKMFESRLFFTDKLIEMGAQITLCDPHRALVIGKDFERPLRAIRMTSPDIRAGVSLLIAALSAEGVSTIDHIEQIRRGYQDIEGRLNAIGAKIEVV